MSKVLYVDTEGSDAYKITGDAIKKYFPQIPDVRFKVGNHKKTEIHHLDGFIPNWCLTSTPLNNHSYVIKRYRKWYSVGWDLEGIYEWKRLRKTDSPEFDLIATVDPVAMNLLRAFGRDSIYLPLAFDPDVYKYQEVPEEYQSDVIIAGVMYENRAKIVRALRPLGKDIKIRTINCRHWEAKIRDCKDFITYYHIDKVPVDELVKYYCGAKIIIIGNRDFAPNNDQQEYKPQAIGRVFQETACRRFVLSDNTRSTLKNHFKIGEEVQVFEDENDLRDKVMHYLRNEDERESIAHNGYKRTLNENTYLHRLKTLHEYVEKKIKTQ